MDGWFLPPASHRQRQMSRNFQGDTANSTITIINPQTFPEDEETESTSYCCRSTSGELASLHATCSESSELLELWLTLLCEEVSWTPDDDVVRCSTDT